MLGQTDDSIVYPKVTGLQYIHINELGKREEMGDEIIFKIGFCELYVWGVWPDPFWIRLWQIRKTVLIDPQKIILIRRLYQFFELTEKQKSLCWLILGPGIEVRKHSCVGHRSTSCQKCMFVDALRYLDCKYHIW